MPSIREKIQEIRQKSAQLDMNLPESAEIQRGYLFDLTVLTKLAEEEARRIEEARKREEERRKEAAEKAKEQPQAAQPEPQPQIPAEPQFDEEGFDYKKEQYGREGVLDRAIKGMKTEDVVNSIRNTDGFYQELNKDYKNKVNAEEIERLTRRLINDPDNSVDLLVNIYGPKGKMPDVKYEKPEEYDSIELDIPEGLDVQTVTAVVIGACMDPKRLFEEKLTGSTIPEGLSTALDSNQNHFINNLIHGGIRQKPLVPIMIEARKEAAEAISEYKKGNKEPIKEKLQFFLDNAERNIKFNQVADSLTTDQKIDPERLAYMLIKDVKDKHPEFGLGTMPEGTLENNDMRLNCFRKEQEAEIKSHKHKIELFDTIATVDPKKKEELVSEILFNDYLASMSRVNKDKAAAEADATQREALDGIGLFDFCGHNIENFGMDAGAVQEVRIKKNDLNYDIQNYSITDFEVFLSKPDGERKLREMTMDKIKASDAFKNLMKADNRVDLALTLEKEEGKIIKGGFDSIPGFKLPELSKDFNSAHRKDIDKKKKDLISTIERVAFESVEVFGPTVEKFAIKSLSHADASKNRKNVEEICKQFDKLDPAKPGQDFVELKKKVEEYKTVAKDMEAHGKTVGTDELEFFNKTAEELSKTALDYIKAHKGDNKGTLETIDFMQIKAKASVYNTKAIVREALLDKQETIRTERFGLYDQMADRSQYTGEKYRDPSNRPKGAAGFHNDRDAGTDYVVMSMINDGYTFEQVMDPELCNEEKQKRFDEAMQLTGTKTPENQKKIAEVFYKGYNNSLKMIEEQSRKTDFSKADLNDKNYCMLLNLAHLNFDVTQEMQFCKHEMLEVAKKDHPEYTDYLQIYGSNSATVLGAIQQAYEKLPVTASNAMIKRRSPIEDTAQMAGTMMVINHYQKLLADGQKNAPDKTPLEWVGYNETEMAPFVQGQLTKKLETKLKVMEGKPDFGQDLVEGIMDGKFFKTNTVNGKEELVDFDFDPTTISFNIKNFPDKEQILAMRPEAKKITEKRNIERAERFERTRLKIERPETYKALTEMDELAAKRDTKGLAEFMFNVCKEYNNPDKNAEQDKIAKDRKEAVNCFLNNTTRRGQEGILTKEERHFLLDVYDESAVIRANAMVELGKKIDETQNEIRTAKIKDTELLVDNPKVVEAMAQEYVTKTGDGPEIQNFSASNQSLQDMDLAFALLNFDENEMDYNVEGTNYKPSDNFPPDTGYALMEKHNWKHTYGTFMSRDDVSIDKLNKYNDYAKEIGGRANDKYKLGIGMKDGHLEITKLPDDIKKINACSPEELQKYRDDVLKEKAEFIGAKDAVEPIHDWADRTLKALDEAHPPRNDEYEEYTAMRDAVEALLEIDSGSVVNSGINKLNKLIETSAEVADTFSDDKTVQTFARNMKSFAETKLPELSGMSDSLKGKDDISHAIKERTETIRRIDKKAELMGIQLDKREGITFAPDTAERMDTVIRQLDEAKKGVLFGSKEYDTAVKSFKSMAEAYRNVKELGEGVSDADRMKAIEDYQEISRKARLDMDKYMKYREAKGPMENNSNAKTQRRIDSMNAAINVLRDSNAFMDDCYAEVSKRELARANKKMAPLMEEEKAEKYDAQDKAISSFRNELENSPGYMGNLVSAVQKGYDKLDEIVSKSGSEPLSDKEKEDAARAFAAVTLYTTIQHAKKNDKGFEMPIQKDHLDKMIDKMMNQPAFTNMVSGIDTRDQIRKTMADPEELRQKYTLAMVSEKVQQKQNAERQSLNNGQPKMNKRHDNPHMKGPNN